MHADTIAPEAACTSVQFHLQVSPQDYAATLERRAVHRRRAARARRELAVPVRQGAVARDPDRAVRAGHRHPAGGAEGAGRAAAGVVRRALDHLDLRPVRGERPLLPGAAAGLRRRGSGRGAGPRRHPAAGRAADAQRHHLPLEPAGVRRLPRQAAPAGGEPGAARRPDRRRRPRQRARSTTACCGCSPSRTGRCGRRCPSPRPRTTSTPAPGTASTPSSTGRASARCRPPSWCCAGCCRWRTRAWTTGASTPPSRDRLLGIIERRCLSQRNGAEWQAETFHRIDEQSSRWTAATRCARCCAATSSTCTATSPCTPGPTRT